MQCLIAVAAGGLLAQLPARPVAAGVAVLFAVGALLLWRGAGTEPAGGEVGGGPGRNAVLASFAVIFLAEWGDLSQLFTAGLAARYADPVSVFAGAWAALLVVSGLAALLGRALLTRLPLATIRRTGAIVCVLLALTSAAEAVGVA